MVQDSVKILFLRPSHLLFSSESLGVKWGRNINRGGKGGGRKRGGPAPISRPKAHQRRFLSFFSSLFLSILTSRQIFMVTCMCVLVNVFLCMCASVYVCLYEDHSSTSLFPPSYPWLYMYEGCTLPKC